MVNLIISLTGILMVYG